jgi:hypothetical protein
MKTYEVNAVDPLMKEHMENAKRQMIPILEDQSMIQVIKASHIQS